MAGLFLPCILTRCRAFILPRCNTVPYKRLQRVLPCQYNYTAHATKRRTRLYSGFSCDYARSTAHDTRPTKAAIIPPVPRWRTYTRPDAFNRYQIPPPRRDAKQVSTAAYYNKVYKTVQGCAPLRGQSLHLHRVSPAGARCFPRPAAGGLAPGQRSGRTFWHSTPGGAVQRRAARNHWRLPPHLFSGFRPIANRGQQ